jgi:hypothetical protein
LRKALVELCTGAQAQDDSIGVKALADIRRVFYPIDDDGDPLPVLEKIASIDLVKALGEMEDRPWPEWGKSQKPITQPQLAKLLERYGIGPRSIRFPDGHVLRGYERYWFAESWSLYLPPDGSSAPSTPDSKCYGATTCVNTGENGDFQSATAEPCSASENAVPPAKNVACSGVAAQNGGNGAERVTEDPLFPPPAGEKDVADEEII